MSPREKSDEEGGEGAETQEEGEGSAGRRERDGERQTDRHTGHLKKENRR